MLISTKHKFCYIANTKVGSTSMESELKKISQIHLYGTPAIKHMSLQDLEHKIAPILLSKELNIKSYYKFSVIREPVSWVISWFNYHSLKKFKHEKQKYLGETSFEDYLEQVLSEKIGYISKGQGWRFQSDRFKMDKLICLENLDDEVKNLSEKFKVELELPKLNQSTVKRVSKSDLSKKQIARIEEYFIEDVNLYQKWLRQK